MSGHFLPVNVFTEYVKHPTNAKRFYKLLPSEVIIIASEASSFVLTVAQTILAMSDSSPSDRLLYICYTPYFLGSCFYECMGLYSHERWSFLLCRKGLLMTGVSMSQAHRHLACYLVNDSFICGE